MKNAMVKNNRREWGAQSSALGCLKVFLDCLSLFNDYDRYYHDYFLAYHGAFSLI